MIGTIRPQLAIVHAITFAERIHSESEDQCYCLDDLNGKPYKCRKCDAADIIAECKGALGELQENNNAAAR